MKKVLLLKPLVVLAMLLFTTIGMAQQIVMDGDVARQPENTPPTKNWVGYFRQATSTYVFLPGPGTPPFGCGSVQISTPTTNDKVTIFNYDHIGTRLADVHHISYYTYRSVGTGDAVAALNLEVDYNGPNVPGGFTTLVFEPYINQGVVVNNSWQYWDAYNGGNAKWWSTMAIPGVCQRSCNVSWNDIVAANPNATIVGGVGINQGSANPNLVTAVDGFTFNNITYDFEPQHYIYYRDADGDGYGDPNNSIVSCSSTPPPGYVNNNYDCDDHEKAKKPEDEKVLMCHKGKSECVKSKEVPKKLHEGYTLGPCSSGNEDDAPLITLVKGGENIMTQQCKISNYPNPFHNSTTIKYDLPFDGKVSIKLYNLAGSVIKTFVDSDKKAGSYTIEVNGSKLGQGMFYYKIIAQSNDKLFVQANKMIIL